MVNPPMSKFSMKANKIEGFVASRWMKCIHEWWCKGVEAGEAVEVEDGCNKT